jgi:hypothetical protein
LAKTARAQERFGTRIPHIVTTSYLTGGPIERFCGQLDPLFAGLDCVVSPGRSIGLRLVPTLADLQYLWEVLPQQQLDAQKEKVRASARASLRRWVETMGEGSDYRANLPGQCIHPVGHWYEIPNLLRNGRLVALLERYPRLEYLLLHNVDTLGASLDEEFLGAHIEGGAAMSVEVVRKHYGDQGGSLARVDGRLRLVESLALPGEEFDYGLSHYNSGTYWFTIDGLLAAYGLRRSDLGQPEVVAEALRQAALRVPSYITIKEVKKRWGRGQEDVFPVAQFERLLGDMTALDEVKVRYLEAPRRRGQQLKEVAQLDPWLRDGSAGEIERMIF